MPDLPWIAGIEMEPGRDYLVMASHLPLSKITYTLRFFRGVAAVRKQFVNAEGLVGYTLRAKPLARDYWTLSVWTDRAALEQFMRTPPHARLMGYLKPFMGKTKFVQWENTGNRQRRPGRCIMIDPDAREPEHTHRCPSVMIVDQPARIRYHKDGIQTFESPVDSVPQRRPKITWMDPEAPHVVENVDTSAYHTLRIELGDEDHNRR